MNHIPNYKNSFRILKGGKISLVVSAFLASTTLTFAAPSGGTVTSGSANISQTGKVTDITQSTQKASINWNKFNVANDETVNFKQPNSFSTTLNRVIGNEKSIINGALNANGQVWILNSNGVLFSKDAKVNTAGLIATTKELSDTDFQAGNYNFKGNSKESVINLGTIDVVNGGSVILAANEVRNEGTIKAIKGKVHLVGANEYTVNLNGNSLVNLTVNKGVLDALVKNSGTIIADGGEVYLTTNAVNELLKGVVNNTGVIEANSMDELFGKVELFAHGGTGEFDGEITAKGGFVETSGKEVDIKSTLEVKAKDWLIDPTNITINSDSATAYETSLNAGTNVTIETDTEVSGDGDITVATNISKTAGGDATLTLKAAGNIIISKDIKISSTTGKLNTILWSDSDATNGGGITMNAGSSINTNGGHLWMGGGSTATIWNGLTVGNSYAIGTG
ncbi:MAG: filamentous hemagglutinin N-terminal domain-containing protein, partial [Aliarcobacter sp.]|nr:filamentous hemagglutinin N-terminal domain-containing protein [Aliarcobacter sp.]